MSSKQNFQLNLKGNDRLCPPSHAGSKTWLTIHAMSY